MSPSNSCWHGSSGPNAGSGRQPNVCPNAALEDCKSRSPWPPAMWLLSQIQAMAARCPFHRCLGQMQQQLSVATGTMIVGHIKAQVWQPNVRSNAALNNGENDLSGHKQRGSRPHTGSGMATTCPFPMLPHTIACRSQWSQARWLWAKSRLRDGSPMSVALLPQTRASQNSNSVLLKTEHVK